MFRPIQSTPSEGGEGIMKELEPIQKDTVEIVAQTKQEKKETLIGSIRPHQNHSLFEYNIQSGEISLAKFTESDIHFNGGDVGQIKKKVIIKEGFIYTSALNTKNAKKKIAKLLKK